MVLELGWWACRQLYDSLRMSILMSGLRAAIAVSLGAIPGALSRHYLGHGLTALADLP